MDWLKIDWRISITRETSKIIMTFLFIFFLLVIEKIVYIIKHSSTLRLSEQHKCELESYKVELGKWKTETDILREQLSESRVQLTRGNVAVAKDLRERDRKIQELTFTCQNLQVRFYFLFFFFWNAVYCTFLMFIVYRLLWTSWNLRNNQRGPVRISREKCVRYTASVETRIIMIIITSVKWKFCEGKYKTWPRRREITRGK